MRLIIKTLIFAILGYFGGLFLALPAQLLPDPFSIFVHHFVWLLFIAYPAYEYFFITKKRFDETDEDSRIEAYIHFIKGRKFTNYIRFISAFVLSLALTVVLSIIGYHLNLQGEGDAHPARLALSIFLIGWLAFYQLVKFGLDKRLTLTDKDEALITLEEYNKIEYDIIRLNAFRRYIFIGIGLSILTLLYTLKIFNHTGTAVLCMLVFCIGLMLLQGWLKSRFKQTIFPHIKELKNLEFYNYNKIFSQRKLQTRYHHPILTENIREKMHTDTYLEITDKDKKVQLQLWERSGINTFMVISTMLGKPVETEVYLSTNNIARKVNKDEIPNATPQFSNIFRLFSDDAVLAYAFMTPIVQENFVKLIANANAHSFHCSVQNNEMVIVMKCGGDLFEVGSLFQKISLESINNTIAEVRLARSLPELLSF